MVDGISTQNLSSSSQMIMQDGQLDKQVTTEEKVMQQLSPDKMKISYETVTKLFNPSAQGSGAMAEIGQPKMDVIKSCNEYKAGTFDAKFHHAMDDVGHFFGDMWGDICKGASFLLLKLPNEIVHGASEVIGDITPFLQAAAPMLAMIPGWGTVAAGIAEGVVKLNPEVEKLSGMGEKLGTDLTNYGNKVLEDSSKLGSTASPFATQAAKLAKKLTSETGPGPAIPSNTVSSKMPQGTVGITTPDSTTLSSKVPQGTVGITTSDSTNPYANMFSAMSRVFTHDLTEAGKAAGKKTGKKDVKVLPNGQFEVGGKAVDFSGLMLMLGVANLKNEDSQLANMYNETEAKNQKMQTLNSALATVNSVASEKSPSLSTSQQAALEKLAKDGGVTFPNGFSFTKPTQSDLKTLEQNISSAISSQSGENQIQMMKLNQAASARSTIVQQVSSLMQTAQQAAQAAARG
ncbi:hypothetical protein [Desulfovibrio inopinatus]|uniref:hypothetical protein n=1 Tax=Desulfovibrio inopinatus TaxID=102109 RepID=UPI00042A8211|nr:hypothetical protein [Desulfovibrio inopinatus]